MPIPEKGIGTQTTASKSPASADVSASSNPAPKKDADSPKAEVKQQKDDGVNKAIGDIAGGVAKKIFGF